MPDGSSYPPQKPEKPEKLDPCCAFEDCDRSPRTGHGVRRVNPPGRPAVWACGEHFCFVQTAWRAGVLGDD